MAMFWSSYNEYSTSKLLIMASDQYPGRFIP